MNHFALVDGSLHCEGVPLARMAIFEFIEGWYNPRRHSALGYLIPVEFERSADRRVAA